MLPSLIFSALWLKFRLPKFHTDRKLTLFHALFTEYRDRRIKNDRANYVIKQARQVWGKGGGGGGGGGGHDPPGITLQRMLLKEL